MTTVDGLRAELRGLVDGDLPAGELRKELARIAADASPPAPGRTLSAADRAVLQRLRRNESGARASVGHLGADIRRDCEAAITLLDRLIGGVP